MRVAIGIGVRLEDWDEIVDYVVEAERLGVYSVWSSEAWGNDAVTPLAYLAGKTSRIKLGTAIIQVGTRTPANVAMTALTLAHVSKDRFILGFGTSGPQVIEGWHGIRFDKPVTRMREQVEIVRMAIRGERVSYKGQVYELPLPGGEGKALRTNAIPHPNIPIYLATLGPRSLELTGEIADGWIGTSFVPAQANVFLNPMRVGAQRVGRNFADIDVQAGGAVAFADDVKPLIEARKSGFAFQMGAMGSRAHNFYNEAYQRQGYVELAQTVQALWLDGKHKEAAALIPDEFVLGTNLLGTAEMVKQRIRIYRDAGVSTLRVSPEGATLEARLATLGQLMDLAREVNAEG